MTHGKELFYQAVSVILFLLATTILLRQASIYMDLVKSVKEAYKDTDALYQSEYSASEIVTYDELIASLFGTLEYDLEINGFLISKYEHTVDQIGDYNIADTNYSKSYFYDSNGNITRIIYTTSVGG